MRGVARYEFHPENGDWPHICVFDVAGRGASWFASETRDRAEAKVAEMNARSA